MDRRSRALVALMLFIAFTGAAIVVGGGRPHLDQGTAPWLLQVIGYLCAIAGGVLLLAPSGTTDGDGDRRIGGVVLAAVVALVLVDAIALAGDSGGANIGAGFVRLLCLVAIGVAIARLAVAAAADRRSAS